MNCVLLPTFNHCWHGFKLLGTQLLLRSYTSLTNSVGFVTLSGMSVGVKRGGGGCELEAEPGWG